MCTRCAENTENMKPTVPMLPVVLGLFCCLRVSAALKCYNCHSQSSVHCDDPFDEDANINHITNTDLENMVCFKYRQLYDLTGDKSGTVKVEHL